MSNAVDLVGEVREKVGKGASRAARRSEKVPAVVYGGKKEPLHVSLDRKEMVKQIHTPGFLTRLFNINAGKTNEHVIAKEIHFHPVTDVPMHIDFLRVTDDTKIRFTVPIRFINEDKCVGLKRGGVLNIVQRHITILCSPVSIPDAIIIDLDGIHAGHTFKTAELPLPEGASIAPSKSHGPTIANIVAPKSKGEETAE